MKPPTQAMQILRMLLWETTIRCNLACAHCRRLESNGAGDTDLSTTQAEEPFCAYIAPDVKEAQTEATG